MQYSQSAYVLFRVMLRRKIRTTKRFVSRKWLVILVSFVVNGAVLGLAACTFTPTKRELPALIVVDYVNTKPLGTASDPTREGARSVEVKPVKAVAATPKAAPAPFKPSVKPVATPKVEKAPVAKAPEPTPPSEERPAETPQVPAASSAGPPQTGSTPPSTNVPTAPVPSGTGGTERGSSGSGTGTSGTGMDDEGRGDVDGDAKDIISMTFPRPKYRGYLSQIRRLIGERWNDPHPGKYVEARVIVRFTIAKSGKLMGAPKVIESAGGKDFEEAAVAAIYRAGTPSFPPIPDSVRRREPLHLDLPFEDEKISKATTERSR